MDEPKEKTSIENKKIRYRIQNDWSDTGPNSKSFNELRINGNLLEIYI